MALFESYERRVDKINSVLAEYGISSIEECKEITLAKGVDCDKIVRETQPICFENAVWAYTVGCAIAIKSGCTKAADAAAAIGIGIDYSIHFATRLQTEMRKQPDMLFAVDKTLETTGQAILINALTVVLGFLVLLGANIKPLQTFGWILAMTMFVSATAAMTFLPALILVLRWVLFKERQYPRFPVPLMYRAPSDSTIFPVINLSLGGLRIHRAEQLKPREEVALELMLPDQTILACQARVIWQHALLDHITDARYDVGLRWVNLSDDALRQLTDVIQKYAEPVSSTK